jgi:hypothetical protein
MGNTDDAQKEMLEVPSLVRRKNNQIEQFVLRRVRRAPILSFALFLTSLILGGKIQKRPHHP